MSWQDTDVFEPIRDDPYGAESVGRGPARSWVYALVVVLVLGVGAGITVGGLYLSGAVGPVATEAAVTTSAPVVVASAQTTTAAAVPVYVGIVEPWSGGAAQEQGGAEECSVSDGSTAAIIECYRVRTEHVDAQINSARKALFGTADAAERKAMVNEDAAWLAARATVCGARPASGGSVDRIYAAQCVFDVSDARLAEVNEESLPLATLTMGKSLESGLLAWYTTPKGSQISAYQSGSTRDAIVCFAVIGGHAGFTVNTDQFTFVVGAQTLKGQQLGSDMTVDGYQVGTGELINFCMRYDDAKHGSKQGSATYSPGSPAAMWAVKKSG
ncbi:DUF1311 domain-containing protein [Nocardia sp. 2]|uniref:DUF1311 domain-containing protein n=1 Tax=Nocardia acididurans TaxID=2802282 RepID=A0ABS1MBP4_9NOCA|nr:lysozyme inhibitor LprI family protein [Nocardia acididurans]MBL1077706.1 DUF1311 domain-containing protein [Nocardia acididurans]